MPIIREDFLELGGPHIYEIFFALNGEKTISYIGKSSGENATYISGSSELNRAIANTVLCFGEELAESGWHKIVLARFPSGTPGSVLDEAEKRFVLASYDECRRLGPGRSWEILNKEYLQRIWRTDAGPVLSKLREFEERNPETLSKMNIARWPKSQLDSNLADRSASERFPEGGDHDRIYSCSRHALVIEANFFERATAEIGRSALVSLDLMAYPGLKRCCIKMRVFFSVVVELQNARRVFRQEYAVKTSTLRYLLRESNITSSRLRDVFDDLASALDVDSGVCLRGVSFGAGVVRFQVESDRVAESNSVTAVAVEYEKFIVVADKGQQSAVGRRYFAILAAHQIFQRTGQGLPLRKALSILSGKKAPPDGDLHRLRELQSSCIKGIKSSEGQLCDALGVEFATNYFTKKKLRQIKAGFKGVESDFRVLIDNSERPLSDFMVLLSQRQL